MPFTHRASSSARLCTSRWISLVSKDIGGLYIGISYSTDVCSRHSSRAAFSLDAMEAGASDSNAPQFTRWGSLPVSTSRHTVCNKKMFPCRLVVLVGQLCSRHCDWEHRSGIQDNLLWKPIINAYCKTCCDWEYHGGIQDDLLWEPIIITYCLLQQNLLWLEASPLHTRQYAVKTNHKCILQNLLWLGASPLHTRWLAVKTNHKFYIQQNLLWLGASPLHTRQLAVRTNHNYIQQNLPWLGAPNTSIIQQRLLWLNTRHKSFHTTELATTWSTKQNCIKYNLCDQEHHKQSRLHIYIYVCVCVYSRTCYDWASNTITSNKT